MEILQFYIPILEILKSQSWNSGFQTLVCITNLGNILNYRNLGFILRTSNSEILERGSRNLLRDNHPR